MNKLDITTFDGMKEILEKGTNTRMEIVLSVLEYLGNWKTHLLVTDIFERGHLNKNDIMLLDYNVCNLLGRSSSKRLVGVYRLIRKYILEYDFKEKDKYYIQLKEEIIYGKPVFEIKQVIRTRCVIDELGLVQDIFYSTINEKVCVR